MTLEQPSKPQQGFLTFVFMTIFQGFLLGIGLLIVVAISMRFQDVLDGRPEAHAELPESIRFDFEDKAPEAGKDYRLDDVRKIEEGGSVRIVGKISNLHPNSTLSGVVLQANLFKGAAFVDQYTESISLRGSESRFFKIDCGCSGNPPAAHDRFEVLLVRSY